MATSLTSVVLVGLHSCLCNVKDSVNIYMYIKPIDFSFDTYMYMIVWKSFGYYCYYYWFYFRVGKLVLLLQNVIYMLCSVQSLSAVYVLCRVVPCRAVQCHDVMCCAVPC